MHLPTYLFLMISAVLYGLYKSILLWQTNGLLFLASVFIAIVTAAVGILQSANTDDVEVKWMLLYTIPLGLLVVGGSMNNTEMIDSLMTTGGATPPAHIIPGTSQDYRNAVAGHYLSMAFPLMALFIAKGVQYAINKSSRNGDA